MFGETKGVGFNIDAKTMAIWSLAPTHDKPTLMEIKETPQGNANFWNVHTTQVILKLPMIGILIPGGCMK